MLLKVVSVTEKPVGDKVVYKVSLEDGRTGSCWDADIVGKEGQMVDLNVTENKKNSQYLDISINKPKKAFGPGAPRNYRPEALACAVSWISSNPEIRKGATKEHVIQLAEYFLTWIKGS